MLIAGTAACGKKGPPLAPLSNLPRAPEAIAVRLQGDQVQIRFRIPRATQSNVQPANLQRVDVYALTGPAVPRDRFLQYATVVASVPVRRPPIEGQEALPPAAEDEQALEQGALAVVYETLTPEAYHPIELRQRKAAPPPRRAPAGPIVIRRTALALPDVGTRIEPAPMRHYVAVGVTRGGRRGTLSTVASVSLDPAPPAPPAPVAVVTESGVELTWDPPAGLRRPIQASTLAPRAPRGAQARGAKPTPRKGQGVEDPAVVEDDLASSFDEPGLDGDEPLETPEDANGDLALEPLPEGVADDVAADTETATPADPARKREAADRFLPARPLQPWRSVTSGYLVYAVPAEIGVRAGSPYAVEGLPAQLTERPLQAPNYRDTAARFGDERCYVLRVAEAVGSAVREGPPSLPTCVQVVDVFPPAAPQSLAAVTAERSVNLIWEANTESDLAGYIVLRSRADGRPEELTPEPIRETTYRDTTVRPGSRYTYTVIAVDRASPPNRSEPSNAVEVVAR